MIKTFKKFNFWRGIFGILVIILCLGLFLSVIAFEYSGSINAVLNVDTGVVEGTGGEMKYESAYGELSDENLARLVADEIAYCKEEMEEGAVLLKNDGALPLKSTERKITMLGRASYDLIFKSHAAGGNVNAENATNLKMAFEAAGFEINETVYDAYAASSTTRVKGNGTTTKSDIGEESLSFYTQELISSFDQYNDAAIVVLSRDSGEGQDMDTEDVDGISQLALHEDEKDLLTLAQQHFDKVIVLLNSGTSMELGWLNDAAYSGVGACLWMGQPGRYGAPGVVSLLMGEANPSGHLVDTYAYDSLSAPAVVNAGDFTFTGDTSDAMTNKYVVYQENIYTGYKYYETRYEDCILGDGNASDPVGSSTPGASEWNYAEEVQFPFGYGLSYTTFSQTLDSFEYDADSDTFTAKVTVTNTGNVAGKSVAQIYVQSPYTDYDKINGVEKSAVQIVGLGKTGLLDEGASETLDITIDRYIIASYDDSAAKTWILDEGTYYFGLGDHAHDALNNILAKKGESGMFDLDGTPVSGDADKVGVWVNDAFDDETYATSKETGNPITNKFVGEDAIDANDFYDDDPVTYLTRNSWNTTYPTAAVTLEINDSLKTAMVSKFYEKSSDTPGLTEEQKYGTPNGILFMDMYGVPFDDPKWDDFLDQLSVEDMSTIISDSLGQPAITSVSKPANKNADGPDGYGMSYAYGTKDSPTCYNIQNLAVSSWSYEIMEKRGSFYGEDVIYARGQMAFAPGLNLHRTPFGGRNFEYSSEDGLFTALMASVQVAAMNAKGVVVAPKHFFGNDQETNRSSLCAFMTEQTARENGMRAFELPFKNGARASMQSMNRIGCKASAVADAVLIGIAHDEWGFNGVFITDSAGRESDKIPTVESLLSGTSMFCLARRTTNIYDAVMDGDDSYLYEALREANHRFYYQYANSTLVNGLTADTVVGNSIAWWQALTIALDVIVGVLTAAALVMFIVTGYGMKRNKEEGAK